MTIAHILACVTIDRIDAELIIAHVLKKNRTYIITHPEQGVSFLSTLRIFFLCRKRKHNAPLAYILKHKEFYKYNFFINKNVLVPRPETELLVEKALQIIRNKTEKCTIVDIGTGCGNIIITIEKELIKNTSLPITRYSLLASDISHKALIVARKNAKRHNTKNTIKFFKSDLLQNESLISNLHKNTEQRLLIIANLPYVDEKKKQALLTQKNSTGLRHEPQEALWSEDEGLAHYVRLLAQTKKLLGKHHKQNIKNLYEISPEQKSILHKLILRIFPDAKIAFYKDYTGQWRICEWNIIKNKV